MQSFVQFLPKRLQSTINIDLSHNAIESPFSSNTNLATNTTYNPSCSDPRAPASIASLYEKITLEFPPSYIKKHKSLVDSVYLLIERLYALQASGGALNLAEVVEDGVTVIPTSPITPSQLWIPLRDLLDYEHPPRIRELTLDTTQRLLALHLMHGDYTVRNQDDVQNRTAPGDSPPVSNSPVTNPPNSAETNTDSVMAPISHPGTSQLRTSSPDMHEDVIVTEDGQLLPPLPDTPIVVAESPVSILSPLDESVSGTTSPTQAVQQSLHASSNAIVNDIISAVSMCFPPLSSGIEESVHIQVLKVLITATSLPWIHVHNVSLLRSLQTCFNFYLYSRNQSVVTTAKAALTQTISSVIRSVTKCDQSNLAICTKDLFLVLRALCKLTSKTFNESKESMPNSAEVDQSLTVKCRILAMDLIAKTISDLAQKNSSVLNDIMHGPLTADLSVAISKNATSANIPQFELSLTIFMLLLNHYRSLYKPQISVLLTDVYLPILVGNASVQHKHVMLQSLVHICEQPQILVDLYTNFDCDMSQASIVEDMIVKCCTTSQIPNLAQVSISVIEAILKSLEMWMTKEPATMISVDQNLLAENVEPSSVDPLLDPSAKLIEPARVISQPLLSNEGTSSPSPRLHPLIANTSISTLTLDVTASPQRATEEAVLAMKLHTKHGLELFAQSKDVAYLYAYNVVPKDDPKALAQFFHANPPNKTKLGEFLGELSSLPIMHAYVDAMEFRNIEFVDALRFFLSGFRLPGEAQKIDRFMEKFADKYCGDNPNIFGHADTAYVLAFSVIMLNTDLHSKQIKKRMSKDEFVRNNRRIDNASVLPDEYFAKIYDEILHNEIHLDEPKPSKVAEDEEQRKELYRREAQVIQKRSQQKILGSKDATAWKVAELADYARLIYTGAHAEFLSCLVPAKSYKGLQLALHVASCFALKDERDDCVNALLTLAGLLQNKVPNSTQLDMHAVSALFQTSNTIALSLNESWEYVLMCLSELDKRGIALDNSTAAHVDCIFNSTSYWPAHALVHFVTALCHVSSRETAVISLMKAFILMYMTAVRFEFNQIFGLVLDHFGDVVKTNEDIARFAVDSLRQLTSKFLERDELSHFNSQVEFMKPFETMMAHASSPALQELILVSLMQLVQVRFRNMKSGWKAVFPVVLIGKSHTLAKEILFLVHNHLPELQLAGATQDYIACLAEVCGVVESQQLLDILESIPTDRIFVLRGLTSIVLNQPDLSIRTKAVNALFTAIHALSEPVTDDICATVIMPLFTDNSRPDLVWVQAMQAMVKLWMSQGHIPSIMSGTCHAITLSVDQGNDNIADCALMCFQEMLKHLIAKAAAACGVTDKSATESPTFVASMDLKASANEVPNANSIAWTTLGWPILTSTLVNLAQRTIPKGLELSAPAPGDMSAPPTPDFAHVTQQCTVHLLLLTNLQPFLSSYHFGVPIDFYLQCLSFLRSSRDFSQAFNANNDLRNRIWKAGLTANPPHLLRQESLATMLFISTQMSILKGFSGQELPHLRALKDAGDDLIDDFLQLPDTLSSSTPLAIKTKGVLSSNIAHFFTHLSDLLFTLPESATPTTTLAKHFFRRALHLMREEDTLTRHAAVTYLDRVVVNIIEPMWETSSEGPSSQASPSVLSSSPVPHS